MKISLFVSLIQIELLKALHSMVFRVILAGYSIAPVIGAVFVLIVRDPSISKNSPLLEAKANLAGLSPDWPGYLGFLDMTLGVGGIIIFGFIISWVFGREYSDKTINDILTLPLPGKFIVFAKFITVAIWSLVVSLWIFFLGSVLGFTMQLDGWDKLIYLQSFLKFIHLWLMVTLASFPVAWFAITGKGYMAPLGFVIFSMVIGQIAGAVGFGQYTPWSIPGLYSGAGGETNAQITITGVLIVYLTGLFAIIATIYQWTRNDN